MSVARGVRSGIVEGEYQMTNLVMPDDNEKTIILIDSCWSNKKKIGETATLRLIQKTFYELNSNTEMVTGHKSKRETIKFHKDLVEKWQKSL